MLKISYYNDQYHKRVNPRVYLAVPFSHLYRKPSMVSIHLYGFSAGKEGYIMTINCLFKLVLGILLELELIDTM